MFRLKFNIFDSSADVMCSACLGVMKTHLISNTVMHSLSRQFVGNLELVGAR